MISESRSSCQARPRAARPADRSDMLCASHACTSVRFHGTERPVYRMHEATYARWADDAEANAAVLWDWAAIDPVVAARVPIYALPANGAPVSRS